MAITIDESLLQELGLGSLPEAEKKKLVDHIYETLELRVGTVLADQMSDEQLDEFEAIMDRNDALAAGKTAQMAAPMAQEALKWLQSNFPDYSKVVQQELEKLKAEVRANAPKILAAASADSDPN